MQLDRMERKRWRYCTRSKYSLIIHSHFPKNKDNTSGVGKRKTKDRIGKEKSIFYGFISPLFLNFSIIVG